MTQIGRLKRLYAKPKVHVRGRDSGLSLGISACQQRRRACVPAHRQAAVGQASCGGAVGKLQGQGLCGWPLCATRGSRVGLASCLAASAALPATSSCCAVAFSALCAAAQLPARQPHSQIGGRPHSLGCTQCFAGVYAEGPAPAANSASHRERSRSAGCSRRQVARPPRKLARPALDCASRCTRSAAARHLQSARGGARAPWWHGRSRLRPYSLERRGRS